MNRHERAENKKNLIHINPSYGTDYDLVVMPALVSIRQFMMGIIHNLGEFQTRLIPESCGTTSPGKSVFVYCRNIFLQQNNS